MNLTSESIALIAGAVLSLAFAYLPRVKEWFASLAGEYKRLLMAGLMLAVAFVAMMLSCWGIYPLVECSQPGVVGLVENFLMALVANQGMYVIAVRGVQSAPKADAHG